MDNIINSFPGYEFVEHGEDNKPHNMYRGIDLGFGGYVYAEPGMYGDVVVLDIASQHPHSILAMNCFGEYTQNFKDILEARIAIKHGDYDSARQMFGGRLKPFLEDETTASALAQALKISVNSVYGLTSAGFDNPFRDPRNKNNIVALRGALFMKTLQDEVQGMGYTVVHIKTDSIKVADADPQIIKFIMEFGEQYGYTFEHEATYEKMCLVNNAVYIAKYDSAEECERKYGYIPGDNKKKPGKWTATGAEFAVPYVFKTLFSKEDLVFDDLCEAKSVKSALYLDMNEGLLDVSAYEKEYDKLMKQDDVPEEKFEELRGLIKQGHDYKFVGKVGNFCPIKPGYGGGLLMREQNGKYYAATGTKGYRWLEAEQVYSFKDLRDNIDRSYYDALVDDAVEAISEHGNFEWFVSDDPYNGSELWFERVCPFA